MASEMPLPADLLHAVADPIGGKITLVMGTGCSFEPPTSVPLASTCSQECHEQLVLNGVLVTGDCLDPGNLSLLADTVYKKCDNQEPLVRLLKQMYSLDKVTPNDGHYFAVALMRERVISSILTLNYDLSLTTAISYLGIGDTIAIINGPEDIQNQGIYNVYYLHRNANSDQKTWILRTEQLEETWKNGWEGVVADRALVSPVIIFIGLGSPADVIVETTKRIKGILQNGVLPYQVDPSQFGSSPFTESLALDEAHYIRKSWCDFMKEISDRLVREQIIRLKQEATTFSEREHLTPEDIDVFLGRLRDFGLVKLGLLRATWLLHDKKYLPDDPGTREFIADLLLAVGFITRETRTEAVLCEDGVVEFRRGDQTIAAYVLISGRGTRRWTTIEGELSRRQRTFQTRPTTLSGALIAHTRDGFIPVTPPADITQEEISESILDGGSTLQIFHIDSLRQDPTKCKQVVP